MRVIHVAPTGVRGPAVRRASVTRWSCPSLAAEVDCELVTFGPRPLA